MKRTQDCNNCRLQGDNVDRGCDDQTLGVAFRGRLSKAPRVDTNDRDNAIETECRPYSTPIDVLTDDILYHLFNGRSADGIPVFPPECRWVPALVCHRWRNVIASITCADAEAVSSRLHDALWDGPPPEKVHHHSVVRASGMALMVHHGLPTNDMGAWTAHMPDTMDAAAVLMASATPERVDEAAALAGRVQKLNSKWEHHNMCLTLPHGRNRGPERCPGMAVGCVIPPDHMPIVVAAGTWHDLGALVDIARPHKTWCIGVAILHATRRSRVDAVRALLALILYGDIGFIYDILLRMWLFVGRYCLLAVGDFLVDLEQGRDPIICFTADERRELWRMRDESVYDNGWNWLAEAAERNHIECPTLQET
jgi:hypothetical protein